MLALLAILIGACATLGVDQALLRSWAASGRGYPLGQRFTVELPPGQSLVWYESPFKVPNGDVTLYVFDSEGDRVPIQAVKTDMNYRLFIGGESGRALWQINIPRAGLYEIGAYNHNFESDSLVPAEDRIVFLKSPDSLTELTLMRKLVQITGATASITLVIVLYILHGLELRKRRLATENSAVAAVV